MDNPVKILIKKPFVENFLQDLADDNAIEILEGAKGSAEHEVPEWQKEETRNRMEAFRKNPTDVYSWEEVKQMLEKDEEL